MKFVLFVEGYTEKLAVPAFLKRWLDPRLDKPVGVKVVRFDGWPEYVKDIRQKVELNLSGATGADIIAGIGLLDLYGPTFYPPEATDAATRRAWAKKHLEDKVGNERFRQHFAVHELEAWLLAAPLGLPEPVRKALPGKCAQPEIVNFQDPPGHLLDRLYREKLKKRYKKTVDGTTLFEKLDPGVAAAKCPQLTALLEEMLQFAKGTTP